MVREIQYMARSAKCCEFRIISFLAFVHSFIFKTEPVPTRIWGDGHSPETFMILVL